MGSKRRKLIKRFARGEMFMIKESFIDYFENQFVKDFCTLKFSCYQNLKGQAEYFFGGTEWHDIKEDLKSVSDGNKDNSKVNSEDFIAKTMELIHTKIM